MMTQIPAEEKEEVKENEGYGEEGGIRGEKRVSGLLVTSIGMG